VQSSATDAIKPAIPSLDGQFIHVTDSGGSVMKRIEMDFAPAESNDFMHADRSLQFRRERRKVLSSILTLHQECVIVAVINRFFEVVKSNL